MKSKQFSIEEVRETMNDSTHIRNLSVIAHVDHGKTTLTDSLAAAAGLIKRSTAGDALVTSTRADEKSRGITIKSTGIAIYIDVPPAWSSTTAQACSVSANTTVTSPPSTSNSTTQTPSPPTPAQPTSTRYLLNLVDSPGHVDFSSEVTAALRVTDGALVVVDCIEGVCVQTRTVLRQALTELVRPVLVLNKLDRCFMEKQMEYEDIYQSLCRSIESVNVVLYSYKDPLTDREYNVDPLDGNVVFASAKQAWGFSLSTFAEMYLKKKNSSTSTSTGRSDDNNNNNNNNNTTVDAAACRAFTSRLWGDWFYDDRNNKWSKTSASTDGRVLPRGFCHFVLAPLHKVLLACSRAASPATAAAGNDELQLLLNKLGVAKVEYPEGDKSVSTTTRCVMQKWIPADAALIRMIIQHLPSPTVAQQYRAEKLYTGPVDDVTSKAIRACDPAGPLCVYISKMVPDTASGGTRFYAFGRVFSGTVRAGQKVNILASEKAAPQAYKTQKREDFYGDKSVFRVVVPMGKQFNSVVSVPAGNTCALVGIDQYILKSCTVTSDPTSFPVVGMSFNVAPVVRVAVEPRQPALLPKFVQALSRLSKTDQLVQCTVSPTGEHIIAAAGELHLDIVLHDLLQLVLSNPNHESTDEDNGKSDSASSEDPGKKQTLGNVLTVSEPVVSLQETVIEESSVTCMAKSPNRFNRVYVRASPLGDALTEEVEKGTIGTRDSVLARTSALVDRHGWDKVSATHLWCFGPHGSGANAFVDGSKAVQYIREAQEHIEAGFQLVASEGPLCDEPLRGVRFDLVDLTLHSDSVHRSASQLVPASKRSCLAAVLTAHPRVTEPVYLLSVQCPRSHIGHAYSVINKRRGRVQSEEQLCGGGDSALVNVTAFLPVLESFGITTELRACTAGQAFPQMTFSHWQVMPDDPLAPEKESKAAQVVAAARIRKGLQREVPALDRFLDKL